VDYLLLFQLFLILLYHQRIFIAAVILGLSITVRYAGLSAVVLLAIYPFVFQSQHSLSYKLRKSSLSTIIAIIPYAIIFLRNRSLGSSGKSLAVHLISVDHILGGLITILLWLLPIALLLNFFVLDLVKRNQKIPKFNWTNISYLYTLFIPIYIMFLVLVVSFYDFVPQFDRRMLSPVFVTGLIVVIVGMKHFFEEPLKWKIWSKLGLFSVAVIGGGLLTAEIAQIRLVGTVADLEDNSSALINNLDVPIYSNEPAIIYLSTTKTAHHLPQKVFRSTQSENPYYDSRIEDVLSQLYAGEVALVYFTHEDIDNSIYRQLTVVITAYQPADTISVGKLNYHVPVSRSAALRVGGNGRCLAIVIRPSGFSAPYGRR